MRRALAACVVLAGAAGCRVDSYRFYDVTRTPTEQCEIRPDGEFCDPDQVPPPLTETWSVEVLGDERRVYVDSQVWVASPPKANADPNEIRAAVEEVATRDPGPCTTTTTRDFTITATDTDIKGEIHEKVRLVGPAACGNTPTGSRTTATIAGKIAGAP